MKRRERYKMDENPQFQDGEIIEVDTHYFGVRESEAEYIEGMVVGKYSVAATGLYNSPDYWIVDFGEKNWLRHGSMIEYRAMVISACAICKRPEDMDPAVASEEDEDCGEMMDEEEVEKTSKAFDSLFEKNSKEDEEVEKFDSLFKKGLDKDVDEDELNLGWSNEGALKKLIEWNQRRPK